MKCRSISSIHNVKVSDVCGWRGDKQIQGRRRKTQFPRHKSMATNYHRPFTWEVMGEREESLYGCVRRFDTSYLIFCLPIIFRITDSLKGHYYWLQHDIFSCLFTKIRVVLYMYVLSWCKLYYWIIDNKVGHFEIECVLISVFIIMGAKLVESSLSLSLAAKC